MSRAAILSAIEDEIAVLEFGLAVYVLHGVRAEEDGAVS
jgi:hypothetical protein